MMFGVFVTLGGHQYWGVLGLVAVLLVGLALLIPVRPPAR
jgi:UMF1 family MFS transporter